MKPEQLQPAIIRLGRVMGAGSVMEASFPNDVAETDPDYKRACQAISEDLRNVYGMLTDIEDGVDAE